MAVAFLVAVFAMSAGFAKVMAICVNWICAQKLARKYVVADKGLNLCLIALYPALLIWQLGWQGPGLLRGGSASDIAWPWWILLSVGLIGFILLILSTIRHWLYQPPACEISVDSALINLRTVDPHWRETLVPSHGRMRRVALLPGNEQFTIDVSTKEYRLPDLPACWDGLSIVHLSDFHFYTGVTRAYFETVCRHARDLHPDIYIFSGDLLDQQWRLEWLPETLGTLTAPLGQYFVLGNHDWYLDPTATRREFERLHWRDLAGRYLTVARTDSTGTPLILCGDETPWMGTHPDLATAPAGFRILVSHTPDNIDWAREQKIGLMLAGHTHGGQIRLPILGPVYSPSRYGCRYASGVFWRDPTLMYVSRGISGKEPVRYNCRPEVTKLVLRSTKSGQVPRGSSRER